MLNALKKLLQSSGRGRLKVCLYSRAQWHEYSRMHTQSTRTVEKKQIVDYRIEGSKQTEFSGSIFLKSTETILKNTSSTKTSSASLLSFINNAKWDKRLPKISQHLCVPRPWRKEESLSSIKPSFKKGNYLNAHRMSLLRISDSADREDLKGQAVQLLILLSSTRKRQYQPLPAKTESVSPSMAESYSAPASSILFLSSPL